MKNKKKIIWTIAGIVLLLAGIVIFCIPIYFQSKNEIGNDNRLDFVNEQIRKNQEAMGLDQSDDSDIIALIEKNQEALSSDNSSAVDQPADTVSNVTVDTDETVEKDAPSNNDFVIDAPIFDEFPAGGFETGDEGGNVLMGDSEAPEEELDPAEIASRLEGQKCVGVIACDKIDLLYAIVEGVEYANIGVSIGHFEESAGIGQEGNCALAGHNGGFYGRYFGDIKDLVKGDEIKLTDLLGQEYTYNVTTSFKCEPTDVEVVGELEEKGKFLTLVTCCENGNRRLIVRAKCTKAPVLIKQVK